MSTVAVKSRESIFYHPRGITAATIVLIVVWAVMQWNLSAFVFLGVLILFIIGLKNPLWAVAAILVSQMTITSYMIATPMVDISLRLILMLLTLYIMRGSLARKEVNLGPHAKKIIIPMIVLICLVFISNIVNSIDFDTSFRAFRNLFVGLLFIILLPAIIENTRQLKIIGGIILIVTTASAIIGIMQHWDILGMGMATITPEFMLEMPRVPGMGETELELAFIFPVIIMVLITLFFSRGVIVSHLPLLIIPAAPILLAVYFTYTRSALYGIIVGAISIFFFMVTRIRWEILLAILAIMILLVETTDVFEETYLSGRSESGQENSSIARDILFQAGTAIAIDNPIFGIGSGQFIEVSQQYAYRVDPMLIAWEEDRYWQYTTLGNDEPHNDFVWVWLSYGTLALIVYIVLHFIMMYNLMYSFRNSNNRFIKGVAAGLAAGIITYIANSYYHNLLATLPLLWIIAGFTLVTSKLAAKEKQAV